MTKLYSVLILLAAIGFTTHSCKSVKSPKYITHTETLADTLIRHEVETIVLPSRNVILLDRPCIGSNLDSLNKTIENEHSTVSVTNQGEDIRIEVDIDSIVNARLTETRIKSEVERVEVPIEVPYPVRNKLNLYLVFYAIGTSAWILRKPIIGLVRRLIIPIP